MPVTIPPGVTVEINDDVVRVKGPKGELTHPVLPTTTLTLDGTEVRVTATKVTGNPMFGTMRAKLQNMVTGVSEGYKKVLEIQGTGYRAQVQGKKLVLNVGYSHPVDFETPEGIEITAETPTRLTVSGFDKVLVGQVAADIRATRPPEPYKGKGIRYEGEHVRRKAGKTAGAV
jgi:large subunit ribosomal protein L6